MKETNRMERWGRGALGCLALLVASACVDQAPPADYGDPTSLGDPTEDNGIVAWIESPSVLDAFEEPRVALVVGAYTEDEAALDVKVTDPEGGIQVAMAEGAPGPDQRFRVTVPLLHGRNRLVLRFTTRDGSKVRRMAFSATYTGAAPALRFALFVPDASEGGDDPCADPVALGDDVTAADAVCVRGRVSAGDADLASLTLSMDGDFGEESVWDEDGRFEAMLPLEENATTEVVGVLTDSAGRSATARTPVSQDSESPTLRIPLADESPVRTDAASLVIEGTAEDAYGIRELRVENTIGGIAPIVVATEWSKEVQLVPGENAFTFVAEDIAGNESRVPLVIVRDRLVQLGPPSTAAETRLDLDRTGLEELLTVEDQQAIEIIRLSVRAPVEESLMAIREPERYGLDTSAWGPAEHNLNRLLNMTPDTADLSGSSVEEMLQIAAAVGLPPARVLAEMLDIEPTDTFISLDVVTEVVLDQLIATHPNVVIEDGEPKLALSIYDVFEELAPVSGRFGPAGEHPGFLSGETRSEVFEPGFLMSIPVSSNFIQRDGVDASAGRKAFLVALEGEQALEFDFLSDGFSVVGLVDEPTVDMRFVLSEDPRFLRAGNQETAGADPMRPGFYRGNGEVWSAAPWHVERIVAESAYRQYHDRYESAGFSRTLRYDAGSITDAAVIDWNRGWIDIDTAGGIGDPPPPTHIWDILSEVAQIRLHGDGIAEGALTLAFSLEDLPIGLDADELVEALRPTLQSQEAELSERLVSVDGRVATTVDFYYVPSSDGGEGFLFFRAPDDSPGAYGYGTPGFFRDAALTDEASTTGSLPGTDDTAHAKVAVREGDVHYFEDDLGIVYRLEVVVVTAEGPRVRVTPEEGT